MRWRHIQKQSNRQAVSTSDAACKMRRDKWHVLLYHLALISVILFSDNDMRAACSASSGLGYSSYYYGNASRQQLRFQDFEPRQQNVQLAKVQPAAERAARGFHFIPTAEDVSVDFEFIVPFVKVPVQRSMRLARDAMHSVLNLHKGALLNTALIVASGAVIAGIVRLVLAPIVFTTYANGFGYRAEYSDEATETGKDTNRSMRSLTQVLETQLDEHNIDVSVCAQRVICLYLQHNAAQLEGHQPNQLTAGPAKLINILANSRWVDSFLNGTAVYSAIDVARSKHNCAQIYSSCSWPQLQTDAWHRAWPRALGNFNKLLFS